MRRLPLAALVCASLTPVAPAQKDATSPPNLLIVFVDDMGWSDIGTQGAEGFETPNLDRLAAEGTRFSDFYVAEPVCSASRAALMTGCYPVRIGIRGALTPKAKVGISADETTLGEICKARGYRTGAFGKWHLGCQPQFLPTHHGFDEYAGIPYSNDMWPHHPEGPKPWPELPWIEGETPVRTVKEQSWFTHELTEDAERFVRKSVAAKKPFFCYLAHPMPHVPLFASKEFAGRTKRGLYGDVIEEIDWSVGRMLDVLDELGVAKDTLVIFSSDNGPWLVYGDHAGSCKPFREGKGTTFEGGVREPFLVRWPGHVPAGRVCAEPAMTIDILPTVARLLDVPLPKHTIDGLDIWPLIAGEEGAKSPHEAFYFWYHKGDLEAMRSGRWKLHFPHHYRTLTGGKAGHGGMPGKYDYGAKIELSLFDLETDPGESHDVSEKHPEVVARLSKLADGMRARLGDRLTKVEGSENREPGRVGR